MPASSTAASVALTVPRLIDDPGIASGCCATLAEDIITQELTAWPGIEAVVVEQDIGRAIVFYDAARIELDAIRGALDAIGYPATQTVEDHARSS